MAGTADPIDVGAPGNPWLDALLWGTRWTSPGPRTVVSVHVAGSEDVTLTYDGEPYTVHAYDARAIERAAILESMRLFEQVCAIDFRLVGSQAAADLVWAAMDDSDADGSLGFADPPGFATNAAGEAQSIVAFNRDGYGGGGGGMDGLARGGFDFITFIHELGHAVGLAHPHDGGEDGPTFPGVTEPFDDLGELAMNQGVFTTMGYNDGWQTAPHQLTPSPAFGWQGGPMALDIAALQLLYGANTAFRTGDDTYRLPDANGPGTFYSCIWDAGGTDTVIGAEALANAIDLRPATLAQAPGGGGYVSWAQGIHGGFTIAAGAVIENAVGGARADRLAGNGAANRLDGGDGDDRLWGGGGDDALAGGAGEDRLAGGAGRDRLVGGGGADDFAFALASDSGPGPAGRDLVAGFARGQDRIDVGAIDARAGLVGNQAFQLDQEGPLGIGGIRQVIHGGGVTLLFNRDGDDAIEMSIRIQGVPGLLGAADFVL